MDQSDSPIKSAFNLKNLKLPINVFYAPLAGCSDFAYRKMASLYKPGLMYCEMVKMDAIVRHDPNTFHLLDYDAGMHPIGAQLCGSKPELAKKSAKIVEDLGFDVLDFNCGCPVDKVTKDGSGSGMLKKPELIGEIISNMVAAVKIPVTVKIRAGWDDNEIIAPTITKIAEEAGAQAICIHGRTREQGYKGAANWDYIKQCKDVAKNIKVIGNGDLFSPKALEDMYAQTRCDAFLISRGTLGEPWIVDDVRRYFSGCYTPRSPQERLDALKQHFEYTASYHNERKALLEMRKVGCWYFKKGMGVKSFREKMSRAKNFNEVEELINNFPLDQVKMGNEDTFEEAENECC